MAGADAFKPYDVFVSYKMADPDKSACLALVEGLEALGYRVWYAELATGSFRQEIDQRLVECGAVVAIWSHRVAAAPLEVVAEMGAARGRRKLVPLRMDDAAFPSAFEDHAFLDFDGWDDRLRRAEQVAVIAKTLRRRGVTPSEAPKRRTPRLSIRVDVGDLPQSPPKFIGRADERALLEDAWAFDDITCVAISAPGGAGKSALLAAFLAERMDRGGDGAAAILGWSAYSQGSGNQNRASADAFISRAITEFFREPEDSLPKDAGARGRMLARLVQRERVLLLLDGLEPLQNPPGVSKGRIVDPGLRELVKQLAVRNPGLLVLTSRQEIVEIAVGGTSAVPLPLRELSAVDGSDLLQHLGCRGPRAELLAAVREIDGHALTVTLLGAFLAETCEGDIRQRDRFKLGQIVVAPDAQSDRIDETAEHAARSERVMREYLDQLGRLETGGAAEIALLSILGLFDRPADGGAVTALLAEPIDGLTEGLFFEMLRGADGALSRGRVLDDGARRRALREGKSRLRKLRLLADENPKDPSELDAHPIVRAYFAEKVRDDAPAAWKTAHGLLYEHYCAAPDKDQPDTLEEMQPLFHAIGHGVASGRVLETRREVQQKRILRGYKRYLFSYLGATGPYLATLAEFFEVRWCTVNGALRPFEQAGIMAETGSALRSLGRLNEAIAPLRNALEMQVDQGRWAKAATSAGNLIEILLALGNITEAKSLDPRIFLNRAHVATTKFKKRIQFRNEVALAHLAAVCLASGETDRALEYFFEAENILGRPLTNLRGLMLCDSLLDVGHVEEARFRLAEIEAKISRARQDDQIINAYYYLMRHRLSVADHSDASQDLEEAVARVRYSGSMVHLPHALLARAGYLRGRLEAGDAATLEQIRADLDEVYDIADPEMRLHLTDLALERARLALDAPWSVRGPEDAAAPHVAEAARLISETGYHRRDGELAALQARLAAGA